jgi:hypothetical protein
MNLAIPNATLGAKVISRQIDMFDPTRLLPARANYRHIRRRAL